jgi:ubiquinone/menaquinone biosynthesis C-methylase UbiE
MVEVARANYPAGPFRQADAQALPHPDGGFDLAVNAF